MNGSIHVRSDIVPHLNRILSYDFRFSRFLPSKPSVPNADSTYKAHRSLQSRSVASTSSSEHRISIMKLLVSFLLVCLVVAFARAAPTTQQPDDVVKEVEPTTTSDAVDGERGKRQVAVATGNGAVAVASGPGAAAYSGYPYGYYPWGYPYQYGYPYGYPYGSYSYTYTLG